MIIEWIGYLASIIIAVSMLMSSLLMLRWINLVGAALFSVYGFIIGALPVGFLNGFIVAIDIYYLTKMYSKKEFFKILEVKAGNKYLLQFLEFYKDDIQKFFPGFTYKPEINTLSFFVLRNMSVAGIVLAREVGSKELVIGLDYAIPEYRDLKAGRFIYQNSHFFAEKGYHTLYSENKNKTHLKFLTKMGFEKCKDKNIMKKRL